MSDTLLLNATYEPLCVVSVHRAVGLVLSDKADVIADGDAPLRSERLTMAEPAVIRLRYFVKVPFRARLPLNRRNLLARDRGRCAYCANRADTMDHVVPRSRGGVHAWENVVAACRPCNATKGDRLLAELGAQLPFTPTAPSGWAYLVVGVSATHPAWEPWLAGTEAR